MSYQALYRKFRPTTFAEVKGQDHIVKTLENQLKANRIGHAYLFCGTRGTGKTTVAKIFARAVNCEHPLADGSPCNECETCQEILKGTSGNVVEIDAASNNGVDNIREIKEEVQYRPTRGRYRVYIIDEVHMLSQGAFNALLKTLEEPPEYVIFILATTEVNKIPVTILSRCQRYNFHRIGIDTIADRLRDLLQRENVEAEDRAIRYVARAADGSMRDALSLLDQCIAFYLGEKLTYDKVLNVLGTVDTETFSRLLRQVIAGDAGGAVRIFEDMIRDGKETGQFVSDFTWYLRNLLLLKSAGSDADAEEMLDVSSENLQQLREESGMIDTNALMRYIRVLSDLSGRLRYSTQKRIETEVALIQLCRPQMEEDLSGVLDRIRQIEKKLEDGVFVRESSGSAGTGSTNENTSGATRQQKPEPVKAAPEDLKQIRASWKKIISRTSGILRGCLQNAVPAYDGKTGGNKLFLEIENRTTRDVVNEPEHIQELKDVIADMTGKSVEIEAVAASGDHSDVTEIPLEELLESEISGLPVEEYEDDEEDPAEVPDDWNGE